MYRSESDAASHEPRPDVAGVPLGVWLAEAGARALAEFNVRQEVVDYLRYRTLAIGLRIVKRQLPAEELADVRFFECRASGFDPEDEPTRSWFFEFDEVERRLMVTESRAGGIGYFRPDRRRRLLRLLQIRRELQHQVTAERTERAAQREAKRQAVKAAKQAAL